MLDKGWTQPEVSDHRNAIRRRVRRRAAVEVDKGWWTFPANVTQISLDGARIELERMAILPEYITLIFDGQRKPCRVVWQDERQAGVQFE